LSERTFPGRPDDATWVGVIVSALFMAMLDISLEGVAPKCVPSAAGISNVARITSVSFAASIPTTAWNRRE
jgi:MFS transporter, DHA2 family, multidrug resistance protein